MSKEIKLAFAEWRQNYPHYGLRKNAYELFEAGAKRFMPKWININNWEVVYNVPFFVCNIDGITADEREPIKAYFDNEKLEWFECTVNFDGKMLEDNFTHIMSLPTTPEED